MDNILNINPIKYNQAAVSPQPNVYAENTQNASYIKPVQQGEESAKAREYDKDKDNKKSDKEDYFGKKDKCETCENRRYVDGSNDPGVSFKTPTKLGNNARMHVMNHEQEHVVRERAKAKRENKEVISQSVTIHTGICPECGKTYTAGGVTRTVVKAQSNDSQEVLDNLSQQKD